VSGTKLEWGFTKTKYVSCTKLKKLGCTYVSTSPFVNNKIRFMHRTRISIKHETGLNLEMISAGKHCNTKHSALEALMCTGGIAERTTSCYMLYIPRFNPFRPWAAVKQVFNYLFVLLICRYIISKYLYLKIGYERRRGTDCFCIAYRQTISLTGG
jgi:hypothetical protein